MKVKKFLQIACCALGGGLIGFSANRLDSVAGIVINVCGVALMVVSIYTITRLENDDQ